VLLHGSLPVYLPDLYPSNILKGSLLPWVKKMNILIVIIIIVITPGIFTTWGIKNNNKIIIIINVNNKY